MPIRHGPTKKTKQGEEIYSQFSSVAQSCPTLCDPMNRITPDIPECEVKWALESITMYKAREAWHAAIHGVAKSRA